MAIDLQQVKADFEGNTSVCRATWAKVLDAAIAQNKALREIAENARLASEGDAEEWAMELHDIERDARAALTAAGAA